MAVVVSIARGHDASCPFRTIGAAAGGRPVADRCVGYYLSAAEKAANQPATRSSPPNGRNAQQESREASPRTAEVSGRGRGAGLAGRCWPARSADRRIRAGPCPCPCSPPGRQQRRPAVAVLSLVPGATSARCCRWGSSLGTTLSLESAVYSNGGTTLLLPRRADAARGGAGSRTASFC